VHGSYLLCLAHTRHKFYLPVKPGRPPGYIGREGQFLFPPNVEDVPAEAVKELELDGILFQRAEQYRRDQFELFSDEQRALPKIFLEHDPPWGHPTDTRHPAAGDSKTLIVHVTPFNALMWDNGSSATKTIAHGVIEPAASYDGSLPRGLVVVNNLRSRGRLAGADLIERVRRAGIPLDVVGMDAEAYGGHEVAHRDLPAFAAQYRFFFNPIRYTSLGLAVCEAMMLGMPVIGLGTTEMATAVRNGISGYVDTDVEALIERMRELLDDPGEARRLGQGAKQEAQSRFSMRRFVREWHEAFASLPKPSRPRRRAMSLDWPMAHGAAEAVLEAERRG